MSQYGLPIELEQCQKCGGIWFDESELFRAGQGEADKIENLDSDILQKATMIENKLLICPRDKKVLQRFTDKHFPEDIVLERCPSCHGIWLNRGTFKKYQHFRQGLKQSKKVKLEDKELKEKLDELIASHQSGKSTETLEGLAKFLSTPVDTRSAAAESMVGTVLNIILTILRVFILKF